MKKKSFLHDISAHTQGGWIGQYCRAQRWIGRFKELKYMESANNDNYFDIMYACFQNIFYIKDWLVNDSSINLDKNLLHQFIKDNLEIGVCRDICNGTKHLTLNSNSVDENFSIIRKFDSLFKFNNKEMFDIIILAGGIKYSPIGILEDCMLKWDSFIENNIK